MAKAIPQPKSIAGANRIRVGGWVLVSPIAVGPITAIYRARPAGADADRPAMYAVKVLRQAWTHDQRAVELLRREATVGREVSHPHLVPVLASQLDAPPRYLVMPCLQGTTLESQLRSCGPFDVPTALWIVRQAAEALDALYSAGYVHSDLKPENILVNEEGHTTVIDLGFARRIDEVSSVATRRIMGTCNYLAPEQVLAAWEADVRSDIYSLGVVLYRMLTGHLPYRVGNLKELVEQFRDGTIPSVRSFAPHVPAKVARFVARLLAKDPLRRPQTPHALIDELAALEIETFTYRPW
ncbi:hypothetical protein JCM19992_26660 [Thermostilla marina]